MESASSVYLNTKDFVSISAQGKSPSRRPNEIINLIALELRGPVTVMKSNIQLLKKFCRGNDQSIVEESFSMCEESVDNILRFINCMKFLSDTDQGKLELKKERLNVHSFINQVKEELRQSNYDVSRIQVDISVSGRQIITDKYLLNRILINLLVNGLKFSRSTVELVIWESNNQLSVVVRDRGIGIPEEEITAIFNPFIRASNVEMISGTGLGLSIVSKAVDFLEGDLYVNSKMGKGTEFKVIIPVESVLKMNAPFKKINQLIGQL